MTNQIEARVDGTLQALEGKPQIKRTDYPRQDWPVMWLCQTNSSVMARVFVWH